MVHEKCWRRRQWVIKMKKFQIRICGIISCVLFPVSLFANEATPLSRLETLLTRYTTYQADFSQVTHGDSVGLNQDVKGHFYLQRPDKFRWEQSTPSKQLVVNDGQWLWVYDEDLMQVTRQFLSASNGIDPMKLLIGDLSQLSSMYEVTQPDKSKGEDSYLLTAKQKDPVFKQVTMVFNNKQLSKMTLVNNLSQTSVFTFTHVVVDKPLAKNLFVFTPPEGVEVLMAHVS